MFRIVLGVEYDGSLFFGWQCQKHRRTIQAELEQALSKVANQKITVHCAGRTDSGVHALEQVVHLESNAKRTLHNWVMGGNANLSTDVRIIWASNAIDNFHARFSAVARFYRYKILNRQVKPALFYSQMSWCCYQLDEKKMHIAAQALIGEHDFSSFRSSGCQSNSPNRRMYFIEVYRCQDKIIIDLVANSFLYHMVRNIVGVLLEIGLDKKPIGWVAELLALKDRLQAGVLATPYGLYLGGIYYPEKYKINKHPIFNSLNNDARCFKH